MAKERDKKKAAERKEAARRFLEEHKNTRPPEGNFKFQKMPDVIEGKRGKSLSHLHARPNLGLDAARSVSGAKLVDPPKPEIPIKPNDPFYVGPHPLVLDTNVLTGALFRHEKLTDKHRVVGMVIAGYVTMYVTPPIVREMEFQINKLKPEADPARVDLVLGMLGMAVNVPSTEYTTGREVYGEDKSDSIFIKLLKYLRKKTDEVLLLSSDRHLLVQSDRWEHLRGLIMTPSRFMDLWRDRG